MQVFFTLDYKFNYKKFDPERLYESFVNYFETMMQYMPEDVIMKRMKHTAALYCNILHVNFHNEEIKKANDAIILYVSNNGKKRV